MIIVNDSTGGREFALMFDSITEDASYVLHEEVEADLHIHLYTLFQLVVHFTI